jgi:hypothetical protein
VSQIEFSNKKGLNVFTPKHYCFKYPFFFYKFLNQNKNQKVLYLNSPNSLWELFYILQNILYFQITPNRVLGVVKHPGPIFKFYRFESFQIKALFNPKPKLNKGQKIEKKRTKTREKQPTWTSPGQQPSKQPAHPLPLPLFSFSFSFLSHL